jgi:hypothetical protein
LLIRCSRWGREAKDNFAHHVFKVGQGDKAQVRVANAALSEWMADISWRLDCTYSDRQGGATREQGRTRKSYHCGRLMVGLAMAHKRAHAERVGCQLLSLHGLLPRTVCYLSLFVVVDDDGEDVDGDDGGGGGDGGGGDDDDVIGSSGPLGLGQY